MRISQVIAGWDKFQLSNLILVLGKCPRLDFTYLREGEKKDGHHSLLRVEVSYYYTTRPWIGKQGKGSLFVMNSKDNFILLWALTCTCWTLGVCTVKSAKEQASESPYCPAKSGSHISYLTFQLVASSPPFHPCCPSPTIYTSRSKFLMHLIGLAFSGPTAVLFVVLSESPRWTWLHGCGFSSFTRIGKLNAPRGGDMCVVFWRTYLESSMATREYPGLSWECTDPGMGFEMSWMFSIAQDMLLVVV